MSSPQADLGEAPTIALTRAVLLSGAALAVILLALILFLPRSDRNVHAEGLTFAVNTTADEPDYSIGDLSCRGVSKNCTMRAAIQEANAAPGPDTISVPAGTYTLAITGAQESAAATGDLDVADDLTIVGAGIGMTIVDAAQLDRVFDVVDAGAAVSISGMTLRNGRSDPDDGGAVHNGGKLTLSNMAIEDSHADDGGAIANSAMATLLDSRLNGNAAADGGGGIINHGTLTIRRSTIEANAAAFVGGGINNLGTLTISESLIAHNESTSGNGGGLASYAPATLTNVTLSANGARANGGGIHSEASLALINVTIADNAAGVSGGGLYIRDAAAQIRNTIVAGNRKDQCAVAGSYVSQGGNMSDSEGCVFNADDDLQNTAPMLGPLADNGGPSQTHALLDGSLAIDHGRLAGCPQTDQRGVPRPQNGQCDIGAFEVGSVPVATPTSDATPTPASLVGDVNCDERVNSVDAALVLQHVAGLLSSLPCQSAADANEDGGLNSIDAALILQYGAGLLAHLPP